MAESVAARCARVRFVLVRPRSPGNVGGVARAVANHGVGGLALVDPPAYDPDLARWMAPNAAHVVDGAAIVGSVEAAVQGCGLVVGTTARERRFGWPVLGPAELMARLDQTPGPIAVVFGPEDTGLSNEDLRLCDVLLRLPTASHPSLNLSMAASVIGAWLLGAPERPARDEAGPAPLPAGLRAGLMRDAMELLEQTDYLRSHSAEQAHSTLFRLLGGLRADPGQAAALRGMAKAIKARMGLPFAPRGG